MTVFGGSGEFQLHEWCPAAYHGTTPPKPSEGGWACILPKGHDGPGEMDLVWHCSKCDHVEAVGDEAPYQVGDDEPCVHCDGGVAVVAMMRAHQSLKDIKL